MNKIYRAQITIEAAIVIPIVMILVISLIYVSMYVHDVTSIRAYAYGAGNENAGLEFSLFQKNVSAKVNKAPTFIVSPKINFEENIDSYQILISGNSHINIPLVAALINSNFKQENISIEKNMNCELIYISQVIKNQLKEKGK